MTLALSPVGSDPVSWIIPHSEVHAWTVCLDSWQEWSLGSLCRLDNEEMTRLARFRFERDRRRFTIRRILLKKLLSRYTGIPPERVYFNYGQHGKPHLPDGSAIRFNTSHSQGWAIYIISHRRRVGVDLEAMQPVPELDAMLKRWFPPAATIPLSNLPIQEKLLAFYTLWTRKEAYLKALGKGLGGPPELMEIFSNCPDSARRPPAWKSDQSGPWSSRILTPVPNFIATLTVEGLDYRLRCFKWQAGTELQVNAPKSCPVSESSNSGEGPFSSLKI